VGQLPLLPQLEFQPAVNGKKPLPGTVENVVQNGRL